MMAVFLVFLLLPTYLIRFSIGSVPSTLLEVLIWICFAYLAIRQRWWKPRMWKLLDRFTLIGVAALLISALLSLALSPDHRPGLGLFKGFIFDGLLVFLMLRLTDFSKWPELPWRGYNISALVLAGWGLIQWAAAHDMHFRAAGPFESPNYLAFYLVPVSMYVIYRTATSHGLQRILAAAELLIIAGGIYVTDSRGGMLGVAAGLTVWGVWLLLRKSAAKYAAAALLLIGAVVTYGALHVSAMRVATSDDIRKIVWDHATGLIANHPILGIGLGGFHAAYSATFLANPDAGHVVARDVSNAHNLYLTLWLNLGLLGLASILYFVGLSVHKAWQLRSEPLVWAGLAALASILVHGFVDTPVWKNDLFPIFWLAIATPWLIQSKSGVGKRK